MRKGRKPETISTLVGPDAGIEGTLEFKGTVRVDGRVNGKICSNEGTVILGEMAIVRADIDVGMAIIMGEVHGKITASDAIEIRPKARVVGEISAPVVAIDRGGIFHGRCSMKMRPIPLRKTGVPPNDTDDAKNVKRFKPGI